MKHQPTITSKSNAHGVRVYIDGSLHIYLRRSQIAGLQSWMETGRKFPFKVEISTVQGEPILLEYDEEEKWLDVLEHLDKATGKWR